MHISSAHTVNLAHFFFTVTLTDGDSVAVKYRNKYTNLRKLKVYRSKLFTIYTKMKYFNFHPYLTYIGRALVKNVKSDLPYKVKKKIFSDFNIFGVN